jgi:hypothetical protein
MIEYNDDEWDEFEEEIEEERPQGFLSTTRILAAAGVLVVVALVAATIIAYDPPDLREVPPRLIGLWTCDDPAQSDFYVEFRREFVIFGTGGTGDVKCRVLGLDTEKAGDADHFTVRYRDMAGIRHRRSMLLDETGTVLRFTDRPSVRWSRLNL